ncbi:MAG: hypothetical protein KAS65_12070 [Candidatus Aminicenantes bacterium]|nr:hypothetical protein [Candidatus Aminicenantes bacterium]
MIKGIFHQFSKQRHIIGKFRQTGAFSVDLSKSLRDLDLGESVVFKKLVRHGVIVHAGSRTYFLDERQLMKYRMNRVKWGMIILFLILFIVLQWLLSSK